jgi:hypothetical protein
VCIPSICGGINSIKYELYVLRGSTEIRACVLITVTVLMGLDLGPWIHIEKFFCLYSKTKSRKGRLLKKRFLRQASWRPAVVIFLYGISKTRNAINY